MKLAHVCTLHELPGHIHHGGRNCAVRELMWRRQGRVIVRRKERNIRKQEKRAVRKEKSCQEKEEQQGEGKKCEKLKTGMRETVRRRNSCRWDT